VGDVISGVGLGLFGRGFRALGPNRKREVFHFQFLVETRLKIERLRFYSRSWRCHQHTAKL